MNTTTNVLVKIMGDTPSASDITGAMRRILSHCDALACAQLSNLSVSEAANLQNDLATVRTVRPDWFTEYHGIDDGYVRPALVPSSSAPSDISTDVLRYDRNADSDYDYHELTMDMEDSIAAGRRP